MRQITIFGQHFGHDGELWWLWLAKKFKQQGQVVRGDVKWENCSKMGSNIIKKMGVKMKGWSRFQLEILSY